ncbi:MAG: hypothetical protein ACSW8H_01705 [bacterium]
MRHIGRKPDIIDFFIPRRIKALDHERELRLDKARECEILRYENSELFELYTKQRIALDALQRGHAKDMAEMTESLRKAHTKLAEVEAERDRYRDALRRAFPKKEASA